jgi:hypothetical protein
MVKLGMLTLILPRIVLDEFARNRERIAKESVKSLSSHFRLVKEAVGRIGGDKERMRLVLSHFDDVDHKIPIVGGTAVATLDRIERLLKASPILEAPEQVTLRAARRAIEKRAPFHKGKNSMADAVIIEMVRRMPARQDGAWGSFRLCHAQQERLQFREREQQNTTRRFHRPLHTH